MINTVDVFNDVFCFLDVIKKLKVDKVYIDSLYNVYGFDGTVLIYVKNVDVPRFLSNKLINVDSLSEYIKLSNKLEIHNIGDNYIELVNENKQNLRIIDLMYSDDYSRLKMILKDLHLSLNKDPEVHINDFHLTDTYEQYFNSKSDDGIMPLDMSNGDTVYIYKGLLRTNKKDKVNITVRKANSGNLKFITFNVFKPKNLELYITFWYLPLLK